MFRKTLTIFSFLGLLLSVGLWGVSCWSFTYECSSFQIRAWTGVAEVRPEDSANRRIMALFLNANEEDYWKDNYSKHWVMGDSTLAIKGFSGWQTTWWPSYFYRNYNSWGRVFQCPIWMPTIAFSFVFVLTRLPIQQRRAIKKIGLCVAMWLRPSRIFGTVSQLWKGDMRLRKNLTLLSFLALLSCVGVMGVSCSRDILCEGEAGWYAAVWLGALEIGRDPDRAMGGCYAIPVPWRGWRGIVDNIVWWPSFRQGEITLCIPLWMPTFLFFGAFAWGFLPFHRARKRRKLGLCLKCGYDLRGSKDRCPECGEAFGSSGA